MSATRLSKCFHPGKEMQVYTHVSLFYQDLQMMLFFSLGYFMVGRESGNRTIMIPRENFGRN